MHCAQSRPTIIWAQVSHLPWVYGHGHLRNMFFGKDAELALTSASQTPEEKIVSLKQDLSDQSAKTKAQALVDLASWGKEAGAVEGVLEKTIVLLDDDSKDVRAAACMACAWMGQPGPEPLNKVLKVLVSDDSLQVQKAAAEAVFWLGEGQQQAIEAMGKLLISGEGELRLMGVQGLRHFKDHSKVKELANLLADRYVQVRLEAMTLLGEIGPAAKEHAGAIAAKLREPLLRRFAITTLGQLGAADYAGDVAGYLQSPDSTVRASAVGALCGMRAKEYLGAVQKLLATEVNPGVRTAAEKAAEILS